MQISLLTSLNLFKKAPLKVQNDGLTQRQRDYGLFIAAQKSQKNTSNISQISQNIDDINEIFTQKILMKSEMLVRNKIGDLYPNAVLNSSKPARQTERYNYFW